MGSFRFGEFLERFSLNRSKKSLQFPIAACSAVFRSWSFTLAEVPGFFAPRKL